MNNLRKPIFRAYGDHWIALVKKSEIRTNAVGRMAG